MARADDAAPCELTSQQHQYHLSPQHRVVHDARLAQPAKPVLALDVVPRRLIHGVETEKLGNKTRVDKQCRKNHPHKLGRYTVKEGRVNGLNKQQHHL
jgi:hypothetical protein